MLAGRAWCSLDVPSLYVRVYQFKLLYHSAKSRSLTIREGISRTEAAKFPFLVFPHYT